MSVSKQNKAVSVVSTSTASKLAKGPSTESPSTKFLREFIGLIDGVKLQEAFELYKGTILDTKIVGECVWVLPAVGNLVAECIRAQGKDHKPSLEMLERESDRVKLHHPSVFPEYVGASVANFVSAKETSYTNPEDFLKGFIGYIDANKPEEALAIFKGVVQNYEQSTVCSPFLNPILAPLNELVFECLRIEMAGARVRECVLQRLSLEVKQKVPGVFLACVCKDQAHAAQVVPKAVVEPEENPDAIEPKLEAYSKVVCSSMSPDFIVSPGQEHKVEFHLCIEDLVTIPADYRTTIWMQDLDCYYCEATLLSATNTTKGRYTLVYRFEITSED